MARYRKRPIEVEAVQWLGWYEGPHNLGVFGSGEARLGGHRGWIKTLAGDRLIEAGDWIITDRDGERYPCKPYVFALTYEEVGYGDYDF